MGTGYFPEVKKGRGVTLTPHPLLVPWSRKSRATPLQPYEPYGLYKGALYLYLFTSPVIADDDHAGSIRRTVPNMKLITRNFSAALF
jgi:hypothetical protein